MWRLSFFGLLIGIFFNLPGTIFGKPFDLDLSNLRGCHNSLSELATSLAPNSPYEYLVGGQPHQRLFRHIIFRSRAGRALFRSLMGRNPKSENEIDGFVLELNEGGHSPVILEAFRDILIQVDNLSSDSTFRMLFDFAIEYLSAHYLGYRLSWIPPRRLVKLNKKHEFSWPPTFEENVLFHFSNGAKLVLLKYPFMISVSGKLEPRVHSELRFIDPKGMAQLVTSMDIIISTLFRNPAVKRYYDEASNTLIFFGLKPGLLSDLIYQGDYRKMRELRGGVDFEFFSIDANGNYSLNCSMSASGPSRYGISGAKILIVQINPLRALFSFHGHQLEISP